MYRFAMNLNINLLFQSFFEEKYHNCQLSTVNCQFLLQSDKLEFDALIVVILSKAKNPHH